MGTSLCSRVGRLATLLQERFPFLPWSLQLALPGRHLNPRWRLQAAPVSKEWTALLSAAPLHVLPCPCLFDRSLAPESIALSPNSP